MKISRRLIIVFAISLSVHGALLALELRANGNVSGSGYVAEIVARSLNTFAPVNKKAKLVASSSVVSPPDSGAAVTPALIREAVVPAEVPAVSELVSEANTDKLLEPEHISTGKQKEQKKAQVVRLATASPDTLTPNIRPVSSLARTSSMATRTVRAIPRYAENPRPVYPELARRKGWQGEVRLLVEVSSKGYVRNLSINRSSGYMILDRSARQTVRLWRFVPASDGNKKVSSEVVVPVNFQLPTEG